MPYLTGECMPSYRDQHVPPPAQSGKQKSRCSFQTGGIQTREIFSNHWKDCKSKGKSEVIGGAHERKASVRSRHTPVLQPTNLQLLLHFVDFVIVGLGSTPPPPPSTPPPNTAREFATCTQAAGIQTYPTSCCHRATSSNHLQREKTEGSLLFLPCDFPSLFPIGGAYRKYSLRLPAQQFEVDKHSSGTTYGRLIVMYSQTTQTQCNPCKQNENDAMTDWISKD